VDYVNVSNEFSPFITHFLPQRVVLSPPLLKKPLSQENQIQMAIAAIKNKKIKLILSAAETFSMPEPTLRAHLNGRKPRSETRANDHKLPALEEVRTSYQVSARCRKQGFSIQLEFLRGMAQILLHEHRCNPFAAP
jgi:hypothetical protein